MFTRHCERRVAICLFAFRDRFNSLPRFSFSKAKGKARNDVYLKPLVTPDYIAQGT